ncbi:MAG: LPXTG cell wall anchor domain-containing protein [Limosilactobacillus sp.]|uniref:LPXTG cell wall anchor domain-containing protein n=1 Tax=Limosilactobacillus sp. TaxID=2773925 RepID=UPI0026F76A45|nr:LPXTG cell wall anchor domain-containing protein [Limosilactobacillus sp.]
MLKASNHLNGDNGLISEKVFAENNPNTYELDKGTWTIVGDVVTTTTTEAQGDQNTSFVPNGSTSDKGSGSMKFSSTVYNSDDDNMNNVTTILRIPNKQDGVSEFDFQESSPVTVYDATDDKDVTQNCKVYYTENEAYKSKKMSDIGQDDLQKDFTDKIPSDFSKVTAVAVVIDKIPSEHLYRVIVDGSDPTFADDAGKTAYVANKIWGDSLPSKNVEAGTVATDKDKSQSASIKVTGQASINVRAHFTDSQGVDHYVSLRGITLEDNKDQLTIDKILDSAFNINPDSLKSYGLSMNHINSLNDNSDFRKIILSNYPELADYSIDFEHPSNPVNLSGGQSGSFNEIVKPYFDGNTVTFELSKLQKTQVNIILNREVEFISALDRKTKVKPDDQQSNMLTSLVDAYYDPLTKSTFFSNLDQTTFNLQNYAYVAHNDLPNYLLYDRNFDYNNPNLTERYYMDVDGIINALNSNGQKIADSSHGYRVDVLNTGNLGQNYNSSITTDDSVAPGTVNVVYHNYVYYEPLVNVYYGKSVKEISNQNGQEIQKDQEKLGINQEKRIIIYDIYSPNVTYDANTSIFTDIKSWEKTLTFTNAASDIDGYTVQSGDQYQSSPSASEDMSKFSNFFIDHLLISSPEADNVFKPSNKVGKRIDIYKDGDTYTQTITDDSSLPPLDVNFVYHFVVHYNPNYTINVSRQTNYISDKTGDKLQDSTTESNLGTGTLTTTYDQNTHALTGHGDVPSNLGYSDYQTPSVKGFNLDASDQTLTGPTGAQIQQILSDHLSALLDSSHTHGMRVDVTKSGDGYTATYAEDATLPQFTINVVYHQDAHYSTAADVTFTHDVRYVSDATGEEIAEPDTMTVTSDIATTYDQGTHALTGIGTVGDDMAYAGQTAKEISGYKVNDASNSLPGVTKDQIQGILSQNKDQLFNASNAHGFDIIITNDNGTVNSTIKQNDKLDSGKVNIVLHQVAHYNPIVTVNVNRTTDYVSNQSGAKVQTSTSSDSPKSATVTTDYDGSTQTIKSFGKISTDVSEGEIATPEIPGYTVDTSDSKLPGITTDEISTVIKDNQDKIFNSHEHGVTVEIEKTADGYKATKITEDPTLPANTVNITYHETAHYNQDSSVVISKNTKYVSNATGKDIQPADSTIVTTSDVDPIYDPTTHEVTGVTDLASSDTIDATEPKKIDGYTASDTTLPGLTTAQIQEIIDQYKSQLFNKDNDHGYTIDVTVDGDKVNSNIVANDKLDTGKFNLVLHQVVHYDPIYTVEESRETSYVDNKSGEKVTADKVIYNSRSAKVDTTYDSNSHQITSFTDVPADFGYGETNVSGINGYKVSEGDTKLDGPSQAEIQKILTEHESDLFSASHKSGMRVDLTKDGDHYDVQVSEDPAVAARTISLVYHETAHFNPFDHIEFTRDTDYVSPDGTALKDSTLEKISDGDIDTVYDQTSHTITSVGDLPAGSDYGEFIAPEVDGYTVSDSDKTIQGPSSAELQEIITNHKSELFNGDHQHGMRVDLTKTDDGYDVKITEDDTLAAGTISVVFHQTVHYAKTVVPTPGDDGNGGQGGNQGGSSTDHSGDTDGKGGNTGSGTGTDANTNENTGDSTGNDTGANKGDITGADTGANTNTGSETTVETTSQKDNYVNMGQQASNKQAKKLPQTGNESTESILGLALISMAGLMGLAGTRKGKKDEL